jgi:hypothetical protein
MILRRAYHKPLMVKFPEKWEWKKGFKPDIKEDLVWKKDMSKTNKGTGVRVYRWGSRRGTDSAWASHDSIPGWNIYLYGLEKGQYRKWPHMQEHLYSYQQSSSHYGPWQFPNIFQISLRLPSIPGESGST